jgi:HEAT repeat protein
VDGEKPAPNKKAVFDGRTSAEWLEQFRDKNFRVRMYAAQALQAIADDDAVTGLATEAERGEDDGRRSLTVQVLGWCGPKAEKAVPLLEQMLADDKTPAGTRAGDNKGWRDERAGLHPVVVEHLRRLAGFDPTSSRGTRAAASCRNSSLRSRWPPAFSVCPIRGQAASR